MYIFVLDVYCVICARRIYVYWVPITDNIYLIDINKIAIVIRKYIKMSNLAKLVRTDNR